MYKHVPVNLNEQTPFFFKDWFYKQALEECLHTSFQVAFTLFWDLVRMGSFVRSWYVKPSNWQMPYCVFTMTVAVCLCFLCLCWDKQSADCIITCPCSDIGVAPSFSSVCNKLSESVNVDDNPRTAKNRFLTVSVSAWRNKDFLTYLFTEILYTKFQSIVTALYW